MLSVLSIMFCLCSSPQLTLQSINDSGGIDPPYKEVVEQFPYRGFNIGDEISYFTFRDLIIESDPSYLVEVEYIGIVNRHQLEGGERYSAYLYQGVYTNKKSIDIVVYNNMSRDEADEVASVYAHKIGQMPPDIYSGVLALHIFIIPERFFGHSGRFTEHHRLEFHHMFFEDVEELLMHSFAHASLEHPFEHSWPIIDPKDYRTIVPHVGIIDYEEWMRAAELDGLYLTDYAASAPHTEDIAETLPAYLAVRWRPERFDPALIEYLNNNFYNRFKIFDSLNLYLP